MSADAKIWQEDNGDWKGICDAYPGQPVERGSYELGQLIDDLETAMDAPSMRWTLHVYPDGKAGLRGYVA